MTLSLLKDMEKFQRELETAFNGFDFGQLMKQGIHPQADCTLSPLINLREDDGKFYVEALVPGVAPSDIEISLLKNTLTITGEKKSEIPEQSVTHRQERGLGKFQRTITLPLKVDAEHIEAQYQHGILIVTLAKAQEHQPKKVDIKVS